MKPPFFVPLILVLFFPSLFPPLVQAFTLNNNVEAVFSSNTVSIDVASVPCENIGLSHEDLLQLVQEAVDLFWNTIPTSRLRFKRGEIRQVDETVFKNASLCTAGSYASSATSCTPNPDLAWDKGILLVCNQNSLDFTTNS